MSGVDFLKLTNKERQSPRYPLRTQHITIHKLLRRLHTVGTSTRDKKKTQQVVPLVLVRNHASPGQISDCMLRPVTACDYKNKNSREALLFWLQDAAHTIVPAPASHLALKPDRPTKVVAGISLGQEGNR